MTDINEQLVAVLERRAEGVVVRDDLGSILDDRNLIRFTDSTPSTRRQRPQLLLVAAAGLIAVTGGLVWAQTVRNDPASTSQQPVASESPPAANVATWELPVSPNSDRIDAFPIVDDLPDAASTDFSGGAMEDEWIGTIGTLQPDGVPRPLVAVTTFGEGNEPFPDGVPGRIDGVSEVQFDDGVVTLAWTVDDIPLTLTGADLDTMYPLVEHIVPIDGSPDRGGYVIVGDLPSGLVELGAPYELIAMATPTINSMDGQFSVAVDSGPFLSVVAATGRADWEPATINSLNGFISEGDKPLIALALSGDEIMFISSNTMTSDQLIEFAETIRIGDESEFSALRTAAN